jgi:hypothetical protein
MVRVVMRRIYFIVGIALWVGQRQLYTEEASQSGLFKETFKEQIQQKRISIAQALPQERSRLQQELALLLYRDQDHQGSFRLFLEALEGLDKEKSCAEFTEQERVLYREALGIYLDPQLTPQEAAIKICQQYKSHLEGNPHFYQLGYLIAVAYANLNQLELFFDQFYRSFQALPNHYLAYKTKAILHAKLLGGSLEKGEKEKHRAALIEDALAALQQNPSDSSLYKMVILSSIEAQRLFYITKFLNEIMEKNIIMPRSDISFYIRESMSYGQKELAQRFLNRAKEWYAYSRVIEGAQEYIDEFCSSTKQGKS